MQIASTIQYDPARRRLWILGQRCHHGAAGAILAAAGGSLVAAKHTLAPSRKSIAAAHAGAHAIVIASVGGVLMLHDRRDHAIWFERGVGSQP
ncbi:MAG: hypothetical protein ACR2ND_15865 [Solirubrobacteraceae bacterium]